LKRIRILLSDLPPMLMDIIGNIVATQSDMDIVGTVAAGRSLLRAADRSRADVVVLARHDSGEGQHDELLYAHCRLKVIEIGGEGRQGSLYELRPSRLSLGEMSPAVLLRAIRTPAAAVPGARRARQDH
jgi:DNA-binding NarL/FixJ family response regulator